MHFFIFSPILFLYYIFFFFFLQIFNLFFFSSPPRNLDSRTEINIAGQKFNCDADDLESLCTLGRGAYGIVEKMRHRPSGKIMAVKVS